jgi:hypothetical protein
MLEKREFCGRRNALFAGEQKLAKSLPVSTPDGGSGWSSLARLFVAEVRNEPPRIRNLREASVRLKTLLQKEIHSVLVTRCTNQGPRCFASQPGHRQIIHAPQERDPQPALLRWPWP